MIDKIIYVLLLLGALAMAAQVALILFFAVLVAGLLFRMKETLGFLMIGGLVTALVGAIFYFFARMAADDRLRTKAIMGNVWR